MNTSPLLFRIAGMLAALAIVFSSVVGFLLVPKAHAATLAQQIICFVDQELGPDIPFNPQTDYCDSGTPTPPGDLPECFDAIDNDHDGLVDVADPDCDGPTDTTESGTMGTSTGTTTMQCADTLDNDSDGVIDLSDPDCGNASDDTESGTMGTSTGTTTNPGGGDTGTSTATTSDAALHVDSVEAVDTTATANDTYADGWRYIFHITAPNNEENLSMRFSDWTVSTTSSSTIAAANNMRISTAQASSTGPVTITAANAYSTPAFILNSDLNPGMAGRQVDVVLEVKIPVGTNNDTYTTSYGVQTLP